ARGMCILLAHSIVGVPETHRLGEALDGLQRTGEKMPALRRTGTAVLPEVVGLLDSSQARRVVWIDADREDVKVLPNTQGERPQGPEQPVEHQRTEIRTIVIDQGENYWLATKIVPQQHWLAGLIRKWQIEWDQLGYMLIKANLG